MSIFEGGSVRFLGTDRRLGKVFEPAVRLVHALSIMVSGCFYFNGPKRLIFTARFYCFLG